MFQFKSWKNGINDDGESFFQVEILLNYPQQGENGIEVIRLSSYLIITADTVDYFIPDDEDADQLPSAKSIFQKSLFV
jgi:hypothetical protein